MLKAAIRRSGCEEVRVGGEGRQRTWPTPDITLASVLNYDLSRLSVCTPVSVVSSFLSYLLQCARMRIVNLKPDRASHGPMLATVKKPNLWWRSIARRSANTAVSSTLVLFKRPNRLQSGEDFLLDCKLLLIFRVCSWFGVGERTV